MAEFYAECRGAHCIEPIMLRWVSLCPFYWTNHAKLSAVVPSLLNQSWNLWVGLEPVQVERWPHQQTLDHAGKASDGLELLLCLPHCQWQSKKKLSDIASKEVLQTVFLYLCHFILVIQLLTWYLGIDWFYIRQVYLTLFTLFILESKLPWWVVDGLEVLACGEME